MLPSRFFHIAKALLDDARGEEEPALTELFECIGKERDDDVSNNVCHNEIGFSSASSRRLPFLTVIRLER